MPKDEFKEWLKATEFEVYCGTCEFLKDGFCTFYNEELDEYFGQYMTCLDCYEDAHAKVQKKKPRNLIPGFFRLIFDVLLRIIN